MHRYACCIIVLTALSSCTREEVVLTEASGIARSGASLYIVGDDADGRYYELPVTEEDARIVPVDPQRLREIRMSGAEMAGDLESIDMLADGRIAVLSEELHCLFGQVGGKPREFGLLARYDQTVAEFGNRGLEGLAVRPAPGGGSLVAVLWEGGYPVYGSVPVELREKTGRHPLRPVIIVHALPGNGYAGWVDEPMHYLHLDVPEPAGRIPEAQRFRGADLVWHRWSDDRSEDGTAEGFIVLLSSENSPGPGSLVRKSYRHKILQRFDLHGGVVGRALDLCPIAKEALHSFCEAPGDGVSDSVLRHLKEMCRLLEEQEWENVNWEGLDWFVENESLVTIYDGKPADPPFALVVELPEDWK